VSAKPRPYQIGDKIDNKTSEELFDIAVALETLSAFFKARAVAMRLRRGGNPHQAVHSENMAGEHYRKLPEGWRW
jgi:hypothetical protein